MAAEICVICNLSYEGGKHTYQGDGSWGPGGHYFQTDDEEEE